jgi:hypothetical protein
MHMPLGKSIKETEEVVVDRGRNDALYFPSIGSQLIIWLPRWKQAVVMVATSFISC